MAIAPGSLPDVIEEHAGEAAFLWHLRQQRLSRLEPQYTLADTLELDERLHAHLLGLKVATAGDDRLIQPVAALADAGMMFTATVQAIENARQERMDQLFAVAQAAPGLCGGIISACAWVEPAQLRGLVQVQLASPVVARRLIAMSICAAHRVDPGLIAAQRFGDADVAVRARALRTAGELGGREYLSHCGAAVVSDEDPGCQFWAAWSAVLLGDRSGALDFLTAAAMADGSLKQRAFLLALLAMSTSRAHEVLRQLSQDSTRLRALLQGAGLAGDPAYVPWLIGHMANDGLARIAGESFSMITGADLAWLDLEREAPGDFESGPNDDPDDPDVEMDADDGLPWPDQSRVQAWWGQHGARFTTGVRHFMGAAPSREHCLDVLKNGYQRQRIAAAHHLCLLSPGTPLFEWRAPAWRQQRELARAG